jgi:hypothetical protein
MLLERGRTTIPRALERMGQLQAQYAPAMYIGLWSRLEGLAREDVTHALERRTIVQGTLQRTTIHLVSAADYWPTAIAVREARRTNWLRVVPGIDRAAVLASAELVRVHLDAHGTISRRELDALAVGPTVGLGLWIDLVRVPPSGTWERRRADLFAAADSWVGPPPPDLTPDRATDHLVRRYLTGFGPASAAEVAQWAGLPPATIVSALARLRLRRFRAENGDELVDLAGAPLPDPDTPVPVPVRFLAVWDASLLAHARRAVVLREEDRSRVFNTKTPHSANTFLVDGQVAGTWRFEQGRVKIEPFRRLDAGQRREVDARASALADFHA